MNPPLDVKTQILALLPRLNSEDLQVCRTRIDWLLQNGRGTEQQEDWLVVGITDVLKARGLLRSSLPPIYNTPGFKATVREVQTTLLSHVNRPLAPVEKTVLGRRCAEALADLIGTYAHVVLSPRIMVRDVGKTLEALEASFPGYLRAGMVDLLIKTTREAPMTPGRTKTRPSSLRGVGRATEVEDK